MKTTFNLFILIIFSISFTFCNSKMSLTKKRYSKGYHLAVSSKHHSTSSENEKTIPDESKPLHNNTTASASKNISSIEKSVVTTDLNSDELKVEEQINKSTIIHSTKPELVVTKKRTINPNKINSIIELNKTSSHKNNPPFWFDGNANAGYLIGSIGGGLVFLLFFFLIYLFALSGIEIFFGLILGLIGLAIIAGLVILVLMILNAD